MSKKSAIVYPGQGSQRIGMGADFFESSAIFKEIFLRASEAISVDLCDLCFNENEKINETEFTQPAILTMEFGIFELLKEKGFSADVFAGHSLGEYSALLSAGVFELEDAVRLVRKRGELMQKATPLGTGAMAAIIFSDIENSKARSIILDSKAEIANINSKDQWVISGSSANVKQASDEIEKQLPDVRVVPLTVSAPFHSSLMKPIENEFSEYLQSIRMRTELSECVLSNFTGGYHKKDEVVKNLTKQISGTVRWVENMRAIIDFSSSIIEVGPNRPLGSFFETLGASTQSVINLRSFNKLFKESEVAK